MKHDLEDELFNKYPKILNGSLIGKRIECNDGWYHLLDHLCTDIQEHNDSHPDIPQTQAFQIRKADDGGLRFYACGGDRYIWNAISDIEGKSFGICEVCGESGSRNYTKSWIKCLCKEHQSECNKT